jgi:hypothetical protein
VTIKFFKNKTFLCLCVKTRGKLILIEKHDCHLLYIYILILFSKHLGFTCSREGCSNICGDGYLVIPEECDLGQSGSGCNNCKASEGYYCFVDPNDAHHTICDKCPTKTNFLETSKKLENNSFPFPSLLQYYLDGKLNESTFFSCTGCEDGRKYFATNYITDNNCAKYVITIFHYYKFPIKFFKMSNFQQKICITI